MQTIERRDFLRECLDECAETSAPPQVFTPTTDLFACWKAWTARKRLTAGTIMALSLEFQNRGFTWKRTKRGRGFSGLKLKRDCPDEPKCE
jgi:hypothetical protein